MPIIYECEGLSDEIFHFISDIKGIQSIVLDFSDASWINSDKTLLTQLMSEIYTYLDFETLHDEGLNSLLNFIQDNNNKFTLKLNIDILLKFHSQIVQETIQALADEIDQSNSTLVIKVPVNIEKYNVLSDIFNIIQQYYINNINYVEDPLFHIEWGDYRKYLNSFFSFAHTNSISIICDLPLCHLISDHEGGICPAGRMALYVNNQGDAGPCKYLPLTLGNVFKDEIETIWNSELLLTICRIPTECKSCHYSLVCSGGCKARSFYWNERIEKDPLCPL
jgi:radical SAM protein with 4Fe4S-binding SPASM domain